MYITIVKVGQLYVTNMLQLFFFQLQVGCRMANIQTQLDFVFLVYSSAIQYVIYAEQG